MNLYKVSVRVSTEHLAMVRAETSAEAREEAKKLALAGDAKELTLEKEATGAEVLDWMVDYEPAQS